MSRYLIAVAALSSLALFGSPVRADKDDQRVHQHLRAYLGVVVDASSRGEEPEGVRIREVITDSPAARAGLRSGDILTQIGHRPVEDFRDLANAVTRLRPGERVSIQVRRADRDRNLRVTVAERAFPRMPGADETSGDREDRYGRWQGESGGDDQNYQPMRQYFRQLESRLQDIERQRRSGSERGESPRELRQLAQRLDELEQRLEEAHQQQGRYGRQQRGTYLGVQTREWRQSDSRQGDSADEGVQVTAVDPDSPAAEAGLRRGDVITRVDDRNISSMQELRQALQHSGGREVALRVLRGSRQLELDIRQADRSSGTARDDRYQRLHDRIDRLENRIREMERDR